MKKEIPRLLKSASIVYAFDCFGTIFSDTSAFFKKSELLFDPSVLGIRWVMIISDSFWYHLKALWLCRLHHINPVEVIKIPKWKIKKCNYQLLIDSLQSISTESSIIHYIDPKKIKKVVYVNNNLSVNNYVNEHIDRSLFDIVAMNVMDFWQNKFSHLV